MSETAIPHDLESWVLETTGASSATFRRVPGGASREAWFVDLETVDGSRPLFLRYDRREPRADSPFATLQDEAEVVAALRSRGALVPDVVAVHPRLQAVLQERVSGETWFYLIRDEAERVRVAQDFIARLAEIHRIDASTLEIESLGPAKSARDHALEEVERIRERLAERGAPEPLLEFCVDWLARNVPNYDGPVVLVQGDTGPGNFLYEDGRVTAIVDWELAHFGDPMDDLAWLSLRAAQEPFTDFPSRLTEYQQLSGHVVDERRIWFYRLLAETRLASAHRAPMDARAAIPPRSPDAGNALIYGLFHRRLLVEALGHALGIDEPVLDLGGYDDGDDSPYASVFDAALSGLAEISSASTDKLVTRYAKSAARLVKYAAEVDRIADRVDDQELDELAPVLGERPPTVEAGRRLLAARVLAGEVAERDYVTQLWRAIKRDDYLMRTASGALRSRTWPPLS